MSGHRVFQDMRLGKEAGANVVQDPGDGGTIWPSVDDSICPLVIGAGAETRSLADPLKFPPGFRMTLSVKTDGGGSVAVTEIDGGSATFDSVNETLTIVVTAAGAWVSQGNYNVTIA